MRPAHLRFSLWQLSALTAMVAGFLGILGQPRPLDLNLAFIFIALMGSLWGRSLGRSALLWGILAGVAGTSAFEVNQIMHYHALNQYNRSLPQVLNALSAPLVGAIIGGCVGLLVLGVAWTVAFIRRSQAGSVESAVS